MKNSSGTFETIDFEKITRSQYKKIKYYLRKIGVIYAITPERFMTLKRIQAQGNQKRTNPFDFKDMMKQKELKKLNEIFEDFPEFNVNTRQSLKGAYRLLSKMHHPDVNNGKDETFKLLKESYEVLKASMWYKNLTEEG